jgi:NAD(P)-dependent dehydrogenase (short-subunit alcohol dehydrogenase family)
VADYGQVKAAVDQVERTLGPIDIWVNVAFTSVFALFTKIGLEEFKRVTQATYLGTPSRPTSPPTQTGPVNLWEPVDGRNGRDVGAHGPFDDEAVDRSLQAWIGRRPGLAAAAGGLLAGLLALKLRCR